jgi:hypothetical protein
MLRSVKRATLRKLLYGSFTIFLVANFVMTGWTASLAQAVNSNEWSQTMTFQDTQIPFVSGVVKVDTHNLFYESDYSRIWFNISIDFASPTPINVTLREFIASEFTPSAFLDYRTIGVSDNTLEIVNASHVSFTGSIGIYPVAMAGNVSLGISFDYWIYTANQMLASGWGCSIPSIHLLPSILRPEGWMYANAATLIIGVILLVRYFVKPILPH